MTQLIALLPWLPSFPPQASPPTISPLAFPRSVSLQSNNCPLPGIVPQPLNSSCCAFQGTSVTVQSMYGCGKDCQILIPFRLPQIGCFTLSLKCFSFNSDNCPAVGVRSLPQLPYLPKAGPILLALLFFP